MPPRRRRSSTDPDQLDLLDIPEATAVMLTYSGRTLDLENPDFSRFDIEDIARPLAYQCRFVGNTRAFYSVAQHCVLASELAPAGFEYEALMHDSEEAFPTAESEAGDGDGGKEGDEEGDDDRHDGDHQAVLDRGPEVVALEHLAVVGKRARERHERRMRRLDVDPAPKRRENHPVDGEDRDRGDEQPEPVQAGPPHLGA